MARPTVFTGEKGDAAGKHAAATQIEMPSGAMLLGPSPPFPPSPLPPLTLFPASRWRLPCSCAQLKKLHHTLPHRETKTRHLVAGVEPGLDIEFLQLRCCSKLCFNSSFRH